MYKKKLLFDAFELVYGYGKSLGVYKYAQNLFAGLIENIPENIEVILVCNSINKKDFCKTQLVDKLTVECININKMTSLKKILWQWFGAQQIIKKLSIDIYFSPKGFSPGFIIKPRNCKKLLTIHDLIPFWYSENGYKGGWSEKYVRWSLARSIGWADAIIAVSKTTAGNINRYCNCKEKVHVVYNGLVNVKSQNDNRLFEYEYILSVGSLLPHKNIDVLIEAYNLYRNVTVNPMKLVICSNKKYSSDIVSVQKLSENELSMLYWHAKCFVFPSLIEGFGFPPLEAQQHGVPVLAAETEINKEVLGDSCMFFNPFSVENISEKINYLLSEEQIRRDLIKKGYENVKRFSLNDCIGNTWDVLNLMLK